MIRLVESAVAGWSEPSRLNTLGALLYRAGRFKEATQQLDRAVETGDAGATPYDVYFLAMTHQRLGHAEEARRWLRRGTDPASVSLSRGDAGGESSWTVRLELEILRREAAAVVGPVEP